MQRDKPRAWHIKEKRYGEVYRIDYACETADLEFHAPYKFITAPFTDVIFEPGFTSPEDGRRWFAGDVARDTKHDYDNDPFIIRHGWGNNGTALGFYIELVPSKAKCWMNNIKHWQHLGTIHDKEWANLESEVE